MGHADSFGRHIPGRRFPPYNVTGLNKSRGDISVEVFSCAPTFWLPEVRRPASAGPPGDSTVNRLSIMSHEHEAAVPEPNSTTTDKWGRQIARRQIWGREQLD